MAAPAPTSPPPPEETDRLVGHHHGLSSCSTCTRFLARVGPPLLIAAVIFMAVSGYTLFSAAKLAVDRESTLFVGSLAGIIEPLIINERPQELIGVLATISHNPGMRRAEAYGPDGKLLAAFGETSESAIAVEKTIAGRAENGRARLLGRVVLHYDYREAESQFKRQFIGQLVRLLLIIGIIFTSGFFTYQAVIGRPLRRLLAAIQSTDDRGLPNAVAWDGHDDEIGRIIEAHNTMVGRLAEKENALAESERRYRQLFDNAMVGIFDTSHNGSVRTANPALAEIMAYESAEAMLGMDIGTHYAHAEDRARLWEKLLAQGSVSNFRVQLRRADNKTMWANLSGKLDPNGCFSGTLDDVTAQVEAQQALKERDELHRAFFEENKAVMLLHDPLTTTIQFVNQAACNFYGYTEEELTAMTIRDLDRMSDEDVFEELKNAAAEKRGYFKEEHTLRDGAQRFVEVFRGPVSIGSRQLHYSIVHDVTEKRRLEARLERMATRDQLTGTYNRHAFFQKGREEIIRARRFGHPVSMLMLDLDHFKGVNDTHGHGVGDEVLRVFALRCRANLRETDVFARLGGEEFAAILVETDGDQSVEAAERLRRLIAEKPFPTAAGELAVTVSIGTATLREDEDIVTLLQRADKGLYEAKADGRNRVRKS